MKTTAVGSRKPQPNQEYTGQDVEYADEFRVQSTMTAHIHRRGGAWVYCWGGTLWSRVHARPEQAIAALTQQGFGSYIDLDGKRWSTKNSV